MTPGGFFTMKKSFVFLPIMLFLASHPSGSAVSSAPIALSGTVSSDAEGKMEGVVISAKEARSPMTVSVVSDKEGRYAFPGDRLQPGKYTLKIRAVGYELAQSVSAEVAPNKAAEVPLKLVTAQDLPSQMTSAEWLLSFPGTVQQKNRAYHCVLCHSLTPVAESTYDAESWIPTLMRMPTFSGKSIISRPVMLPMKVSVRPEPDLAKYLSTINLSSNTSPVPKWNYELKTLPRPTGKATRVVITEYEMPGVGRLPHDATPDKQGTIWYNDFQQDIIGRLDPRTGQTKEWRMQSAKPGAPGGILEIEFDRDGYLWIPRFYEAAITRFDPKTETFKTWPIPSPYIDDAFVSPGGPDGTVWVTDAEERVVFNLDPKTDKINTYKLFPDFDPSRETRDSHGPAGHYTYGITVDSKGNAVFADIAGGNIGTLDAKTGKATLYPTPTPDSGPRRVYMDSDDRLWFGENYASKLGMFDTRTHEFREWTPPTPYTGPYPVMTDKNGEAWTAGMPTDLILRLNPKTGQFTEYLLPTLDANIRDIYVDSSTTPISVWVTEVHQGKIAKIEPLD
jgi:virginiamycin B lyase